MSETVVPLWKQELLKRREVNTRQANQENSVRHRQENSGRFSSGVHRGSREVERKGDVPFGRQSVPDQKMGGSSRKGTLVNHGAISQDGVDCFGNDTRLEVETQEKYSHLSSINHVDHYRLDHHESSSQTKERTGKFTRNGSAKGFNNRETTSDISRLDNNLFAGDHEFNTSSITLDDKERGILKSFVVNDGGVDSEHIVPKDVKRMWKRQESKEELYVQPLMTKNVEANQNHIDNLDSKEQKNKPTTPLIEEPKDNVPKAYRSPYAKRGWERQTSTTAVKSRGNSQDLHLPESNGFEKIKKQPPLDTRNVTSGKGAMDDKVENNHIPSVKSLLGLFGGKSVVGRRSRDDLSCVKKNEKEVDGRFPFQSKLKTSGQSKPGLSRHHSEPNLHVQPSKSQSVQASSSSEEFPSKTSGQPSHNVSVGIKERMSRLRRASQSLIENVQIDSEIVDKEKVSGSQNAKEEVKEDKLLVSRKDHMLEPKQQVSNENLPTMLKEEVMIVQAIGQDKEDSYVHVRKVADEKISNVQNSSASPVDANDLKEMNDLSDGIKITEQEKVNSQQEPLEVEQENKDAHKPSFDKLRSVFGARVEKKPTPDGNDSQERKSDHKYVNKQNNYIVEGGHSDGGLGDQVVSTENSKGIIKDQQEYKKDIKTEKSNHEQHEAPRKVEKKQRRSLLNVVDPLEVLQLTKDPILTKGKPISHDIGLLKEPQSGRKSKDEIIKSRPDNKAKIAQINRAWDLNHVEPSLPPASQVSQQTMPSDSSPQTTTTGVQPPKKNIPVTSIDVIPVSSIDEVVGKPATLLNVGNAKFYTGSASSESSNCETEVEEEFIPVSSIDDVDPSSLIPPEIVFEKKIETMKSSFISRRTKKRGDVSFFQHVFIHDYQSESSATADWDFENGQTFGSYTPAAVRQYAEIDLTEQHIPPPVPPVDVVMPPDDSRNDDGPTVLYNEEESLGFIESSDSTAGALLF